MVEPSIRLIEFMREFALRLSMRSVAFGGGWQCGNAVLDANSVARPNLMPTIFHTSPGLKIREGWIAMPTAFKSRVVPT